MGKWMWVCAVVVLVVIVAAGAYMSTKEASPDVRFAKEEQVVRDSLRDPASAQFRNLRGEPGLLCGQVNSKNGFGGYVGFKDFMALGRYVVIRDESLTDPSEIATQESDFANCPK